MAQEMTMFNKGLEGRELTCNKCTPSVKNNQSFFRYYTHLFTGKMRFIRKVFLFFNYLNVKNHKNPRFPYWHSMEFIWLDVRLWEDCYAILFFKHICFRFRKNNFFPICFMLRRTTLVLSEVMMVLDFRVSVVFLS